MSLIYPLCGFLRHFDMCYVGVIWEWVMNVRYDGGRVAFDEIYSLSNTSLCYEASKIPKK